MGGSGPFFSSPHFCKTQLNQILRKYVHFKKNYKATHTLKKVKWEPGSSGLPL
jgi:hypothetical protein